MLFSMSKVVGLVLECLVALGAGESHLHIQMYIRVLTDNNTTTSLYIHWYMNHNNISHRITQTYVHRSTNIQSTKQGEVHWSTGISQITQIYKTFSRHQMYIWLQVRLDPYPWHIGDTTSGCAGGNLTTAY